MNFPENSVSFLKNLVSRPHKVLITTHYNPDGDAIGASLALYHFLLKTGHDVSIVVPNELPSFLSWMPGTNNVMVYNKDEDSSKKLISEAETIFCMDFNSLSRVKFFSKQLAEAPGVKILIDHHLQPSDEFDLTFSEISVSSTSELLYKLINLCGCGDLVDLPAAECIFVGIMTDTGSYSYSCEKPDTFHITAELISLGVNVERIHRLVYDTYSENRMRLLGFCLSERMKVLPQMSTAYIWLSKDDLEKFGYQPGDTEGVVNYALSIENIVMAALFTERDNRIRISLRSKGNFSVNNFARKHFEGGGHRNAAGADSFLSLQATLDMFESLLSDYQDELCGSRTTN
ncbi:MAG TPA: bifunctional oligoribonuclease/PAP phosphatase NrnA [Bacteroidales bacterium]|nr:bifunctional oligoribonuclease/PAP phosphatase NrnA [Bacteroidales bacterium]